LEKSSIPTIKLYKSLQKTFKLLEKICQKEVQDFIDNHLDDDVKQLAFKKNPFPELEYKVVLNQIATKAKAKIKLPLWFSTKGIIYPEKISLEQTSSEKTAAYKANLVSGKRIVDLTGGFGVDAYYFAKNVKSVIHCEINPDLSSLVAHNFKCLGATNIQCYTGDSLTFLEQSSEKFDWIYLDPSRRNNLKEKVFLLADCLPNVPHLLPTYLEKAHKILIKMAPFLDISSALKELKNVHTIHIVSLQNEVKELLFEIDQQPADKIALKTIDFGTKITVFDAHLGEEAPQLRYGLPQKYIYEPNSAVMKSGLFDVISSRFQLFKLHQNSHLYTSDKCIDFPGRIFIIDDVFAYNKENIKAKLTHKKCNITTRNFPETVENIRKKWNIKDGGNTYGFFTTDYNNQKIVLLCTKI